MFLMIAKSPAPTLANLCRRYECRRREKEHQILFHALFFILLRGKSSIMNFVITYLLKYTDTPLEEWKQWLERVK